MKIKRNDPVLQAPLEYRARIGKKILIGLIMFNAKKI